MSKKKSIYCSIGEPGKNKRRGSMRECAEKKQVRYYGIKKIDPRLLEASKKGSKDSKMRDKLAIKMVGLRGRVTRLTRDHASEKDKDKKAKLAEELSKSKKELIDITAKFKKADAGRQRGGSKKGSRKGSRKGSKKGSSRKGSRKGSRRGSRKGSGN
jgi:hypothetical protein